MQRLTDLTRWHAGLQVFCEEGWNGGRPSRPRKAGRPVDAPSGGIAADSLAPRRLGEKVFPIAQRWVQSALVGDEEIATGQRRLWSELRVPAESGE